MSMMSLFFNSFKPSPGYEFMWIILVFFILMIAIVIERAIYVYARSNINADRFMAKIRELVMKENYDKAIELNKNYADAYYSRGLSKISLFRYDDGCTDLKKAISLGNKPSVDLAAQFCK